MLIDYICSNNIENDFLEMLVGWQNDPSDYKDKLNEMFDDIPAGVLEKYVNRKKAYRRIIADSEDSVYEDERLCSWTTDQEVVKRFPTGSEIEMYVEDKEISEYYEIEYAITEGGYNFDQIITDVLNSDIYKAEEYETMCEDLSPCESEIIAPFILQDVQFVLKEKHKIH